MANTNELTVKQYANNCGISVQAAHKRLKKAVLPGNVDKLVKVTPQLFLVKMK